MRKKFLFFIDFGNGPTGGRPAFHDDDPETTGLQCGMSRHAARNKKSEKNILNS